MDQSEDPRDLERRIEQATRIARNLTDETTVQRLTAFAEHLRQKLRQLVEARRIRHETRTRARELWDQNGRPSGRDEEFWLQAESEIRVRNQQ